MHGLGDHAILGVDTHYGADAVTVRACADRLDADGVILRTAYIVEKVSWTAVGCQQNVQCAIIVDVGISGATPHEIARESELVADFLKLVVTFIVKNQRHLSVGDLRLDARDIGLDVAVGDEEVFEAVEVVVKEKQAKGE